MVNNKRSIGTILEILFNIFRLCIGSVLLTLQWLAPFLIIIGYIFIDGYGQTCYVWPNRILILLIISNIYEKSYEYYQVKKFRYGIDSPIETALKIYSVSICYNIMPSAVMTNSALKYAKALYEAAKKDYEESL